MIAAKLFAPLCLLGASNADTDTDTDGDGLSDFHEVHKYRTDPKRADSDGDGVPDGDWSERREFTYTVRSIVEVLRPVTPETLHDDFQDARVLREAQDRVQLEVVHYPYSTANDALGRLGRGATSDSARWLEPGPTSDASPALGEAIRAALAADGIDCADLEDPAAVARIATWLCRHASYRDGFTVFTTAFDAEGSPFVPEELQAHMKGDPLECWPREISARSMFERGERGSCTSSAIYLTGCLRALGIPTRTILTIPLFDAGDDREWAMVRERITAPGVQRALLTGMSGLERHWASHTMNEVLLGGHWWRLDYGELGVGSLRPDRFGLSTRVGTFHDWADARAWETIGRRQTLHLRDAVLDGANPYSALVVDEEFGVHSTLVLPEPKPLVGRIEALTWSDDPALPPDVFAGLGPRGRFGLVASVRGVDDQGELRALLAIAPRRVWLEAEGHPSLGVALDEGYWWWRGRDEGALVYVPFGPADRRDLALGVRYSPRTIPSDLADLQVAEGLEVIREAVVAEKHPFTDRIQGVLVDERGAPIQGRVALVSAQRSYSSMTGSDGRFEFAVPRDVDVALHGSAAGSLVGVLTEFDGGAPLTLTLRPGAMLEITLLGGKRHRCAIFYRDVRIEDFTLRPNEASSVAVPAGEIRVLVYDGEETLGESTTRIERGASESLVFELEK